MREIRGFFSLRNCDVRHILSWRRKVYIGSADIWQVRYEALVGDAQKEKHHLALCVMGGVLKGSWIGLQYNLYRNWVQNARVEQLCAHHTQNRARAASGQIGAMKATALKLIQAAVNRLHQGASGAAITSWRKTMLVESTRLAIDNAEKER